jgi:hypothetical protein
VPVEVHGGLDGRMAEPHLDGLRVHAKLEDRRMRVAKVVGVAGEANRRLDCLRPRPAPEVVRPEGAA